MDKKLIALKKAGIKTNKFFALDSQESQKSEMKKDNGIVNSIKKDGDLPNNHLFRRWIMAQIFRAISNIPKDDLTAKSLAVELTGSQKRKYPWKMMVNELNAQCVMVKNNDYASFYERNHFFNKEVVISLIDSRERYSKLNYIECENWKERIKKTSSPKLLYKAVLELSKKIDRSFYPSKKWENAYLCAGAFYTMQNLIRFHDCTFAGMDKEKSLKHLNKMLEKNTGSNKYLSNMLSLLVDNNIDIDKKRKEWRKAKMNK